VKGAYDDLSLQTTPENQVMGNLPASTNTAISGSFFARGVVTGSAFAMSGTAFRSLGRPVNGTMIYCSDCTIAPVCSPGGHGAFAKRLNNEWICN
jgi:hypothetical protein